MSRAHLFRCAECGGHVVDATGPGRAHQYHPGVELPIPADFAVPTCKSCGETYFSVERGDALAKAQRPAFDAWLKSRSAELVPLLVARHRVSLRHLETACGLTPTYLSHVKNGRKTPSLMLVRLLEAFASSSTELQRHLDGRPWRRDEPLSLGLIRAQEPTSPTVPISGTPLVMTASRSTTYDAPTLVLGRPSNDDLAA